jgi:hypothetical protein
MTILRVRTVIQVSYNVRVRVRTERKWGESVTAAPGGTVKGAAK